MKIIKVTCPDCGTEISKSNISKHLGSKKCKHNQNKSSKSNGSINTSITNIKVNDNGKYSCPYCDKEYTKNGLGTHIWRAHGDGVNFTANTVKHKNGTAKLWNKGLTKETDDRIKKAVEKYKSNIKNGIIKPWNKGVPTTKEHKEAISTGMKLAHKEGRAHNIGQCRWNNKKSYPEEFFTKVIENEFKNKNYTNEFPVGIYSIDFAWVEKKLAIEIDGQQHEKPEYKARDNRKDLKLKQEGWKLLRIKWIDMFNNPQKYIRIAKDFVDNAE